MAALIVLACLAPRLSVVNHLDAELVAARAGASARAASGDFVFVAIDQKSLSAIGTWPWPRHIHARLIDTLVAAGAGDIFLDIDFSSTSTQEADLSLQQALEAAGGGVILPLFRQRNSAGETDTLQTTRPLPVFADNAWTALVDVALDDDGLVRSVPLTAMVDGVPRSSAAAVLAGAEGQQADRLEVDFSILPQTVPTFSVSDILSGKVPADVLHGRSIIVGAYAIELKDFFTVPVHGTVSGPMLHILAAETLVQDRDLVTIPGPVPALASALLIIAYTCLFRRWPLSVALFATTLVLFAYEGGAYLLYLHAAVNLQTAAAWCVHGFGLLIVIADKMGIKDWIAELAKSQNRDIRRVLKRVISDSIDPIIILDARACLLDASATLRPTLDLGAPVPIGTSLAEFAPSELVTRVSKLVATQTARPGKSVSETVPIVIGDGGGLRHLDAVITVSPFERLGQDGLSSVGTHITCIVLRDVTARKLYERKLEALAKTDDLTGALSRRGFCEAMGASGIDYALFAVDLHRFNFINETLGREKGDRVLQVVAARLTTVAGETGLVGRVDGNVLCLAVPALECPSLSSKAEALLAAFDTPYDIDGMTVTLEAHIGAALGTAAAGDPVKWLEAAEHALSEAKQIGGQGWKAYEPASALRRMRSRLLEAEMRSAMENGQFFLRYQPQIALETRRVIGVEALARWQHPTIGAISPGEFIPIAEANGFITELGRLMLFDACRTATGWPDDLSVAVNVSPVQFQRGTILRDVRDAIKASGLAPRRLHLEITESLFLERSEGLFDTLDALRRMGISIALDDFGTGYSSLGYLTRLPLDKLKIDQSFVRDMADETGAGSIVRTIVALAHSLHLQVIAEGVETQEQCDLLTALGCEAAQGYYFGKPMSAEEILQLARAGLLPPGGPVFNLQAKAG